MAKPTTKHLIVIASLQVGIVLMASAQAAGTARADDVTLFAAASTTGAVEDLVRRYGGADGDQVRPVFAASSTLAKQIAQGAPADLFLSANVDWMDHLAERGAIELDSRVDLMGNRLALIAPFDGTTEATEVDPPMLSSETPLADWLGDKPFAIADPDHVPAGIYGRAALDELGQWQVLTPHTVRTADVRAALALVDRGEAAAGLVYASDAALSARVRVIALIPADSHPPIVYPLALVAGRANPVVLRFYEFLTGPEAAEVFRAHGFLVPPAPGP